MYFLPQKEKITGSVSPWEIHYSCNNCTDLPSIDQYTLTLFWNDSHVFFIVINLQYKLNGMKNYYIFNINIYNNFIKKNTYLFSSLLVLKSPRTKTMSFILWLRTTRSGGAAFVKVKEYKIATNKWEFVLVLLSRLSVFFSSIEIISHYTFPKINLY